MEEVVVLFSFLLISSGLLYVQFSGRLRVKGTEVVSRLYSLVLLGEGRGLVEAGGKRV